MDTIINDRDLYNLYLETVKKIYDDSFIKKNNLLPENLRSFNKTMAMIIDKAIEKFSIEDIELLVDKLNERYDNILNNKDLTEEEKNKINKHNIILGDIIFNILSSLNSVELNNLANKLTCNSAYIYRKDNENKINSSSEGKDFNSKSVDNPYDYYEPINESESDSSEHNTESVKKHIDEIFSQLSENNITINKEDTVIQDKVECTIIKDKTKDTIAQDKTKDIITEDKTENNEITNEKVTIIHKEPTNLNEKVELVKDKNNTNDKITTIFNNVNSDLNELRKYINTLEYENKLLSDIVEKSKNQTDKDKMTMIKEIVSTIKDKKEIKQLLISLITEL